MESKESFVLEFKYTGCTVCAWFTLKEPVHMSNLFLNAQYVFDSLKMIHKSQ